MDETIVGRDKEREILENIWDSKNPELVAIYGRRRVGKTFLIREVFSSHPNYFELIGEKDTTLREQLENFSKVFKEAFHRKEEKIRPRTWKNALDILTEEMKKTPSKKFLIFFDEVPWLAGKRSKFLQAISYYWNAYWTKMPNVKVILCGSAASWMIEKLIRAKGGLHNRITKRIRLEPFNLRETREYLAFRKVRFTEKQVLDLYMVTGGVPFYLNEVVRNKSVSQNIQAMSFSKDGILFDEFELLFASLFALPEVNMELIHAIGSKREGISRKELLETLKISSGGRFNRRLKELEAAGFIQAFIPYGKRRKDQYFRIVDEYASFYLTWIHPVHKKGFHQPSHWKTCCETARWASWAGHAFEMICFKHLEQIMKALGLDSIPSEVSNWRFIPKPGSKEDGAQIDLLFDRVDKTVTLCEIKYSEKTFVIDKSYARELHRKFDVFREKTGTDKHLILAMITAMGVEKGTWMDEIPMSEVVLKDLFQ